MDAETEARLRSRWERYLNTRREHELAREDLDSEVDRLLRAGGTRQATIAHVLGCSRQNVQEMVRRNQRRREREGRA